ncbi:hypothetical protein KIN20_016843 [Parelaphostrongylus tenuis]|uniref:Uncharacterized protein n=1 Tax=Parelaphostrongylus tenuis TaxID=148309 RepID=A0AAD5QTE9_PARTN|nr:hypothetical protein KIN20_016843 [Parelaphostrongylus tenuis]
MLMVFWHWQGCSLTARQQVDNRNRCLRGITLEANHSSEREASKLNDSVSPFSGKRSTSHCKVSVAHQSRMSKIADLVNAGDVNPSKPVLEQPGGPPQKIICELLSRDDEKILIYHVFSSNKALSSPLPCISWHWFANTFRQTSSCPTTFVIEMRTLAKN